MTYKTWRPVLPMVASFCLAAMASRPSAADGLATASTAILVTPLNQPHVVLGDDGRDHVEYDLLITNAFAAPVTLKRVEVTSPGGAVLGRVDGATLVAATQGVLEQSPVSQIPASGAATVEIDLALPPGAVPRALSNRISYAVPSASPHMAAIIGSFEVRGPDLAVPPVRAITIESPLRGAGWTSINACCTPNAHRNARVASGTRIGTAETFAIDYVRVDGNRFYQGDGSSNAQYPYFGVPIHAVAAGTVVALHDGMEESVPFQTPILHKPEDFGGNYVLIRQAEDVYAFYAHMQKGSVAVVVGQQVGSGTVIGRVGNSGNSTNAHLHFGLLDRPDFMGGYSLPFVFARFTLTGHVTGGDDNGTLHIRSDGREVGGGYPLVGDVATYR